MWSNIDRILSEFRQIFDRVLLELGLQLVNTAPPIAAPDASLHDQEMPTPAPNTLTSPTRLTRDQIIQNSPNRVTRGYATH
jgi:hypothetical protein